MTERKNDMGKAVLYVRVGTEEQLVNDHAEKQAVADGLKICRRILVTSVVS